MRMEAIAERDRLWLGSGRNICIAGKQGASGWSNSFASERFRTSFNLRLPLILTQMFAVAVAVERSAFPLCYR